MHVEECCHALLNHLLPIIDPTRSGLAIDVGVGTFALYFELFDQLSFPTIAVEPLPIEYVKQLCQKRNIQLLEACISDQTGMVDMYIGTYEGNTFLDVSSMRPDWWGSSACVKQVPSMSLSELVKAVHAQRITCLKIDVEGMECSIIRQLSMFQEHLLPALLMFEYGGGGTFENRKGGWKPENLADTIKSLGILYNCGYRQAILIDSCPDTQERIFTLTSKLLMPEIIFHPQGIYGNIIVLRETMYPEEKISAICTPYRNHLSPPPLLQISVYRFRRFVRTVVNRITELWSHVL